MTDDRIEELFAAALALEPAARSDYLRAHATDEAEVEEVLSLLDHHARIAADGGFLDAPAARIDADVIDRIRAQETDRETLPVLEGFRVLSVLGRGGMGVVYRAEQLQPRRLVALKVVDPRHSQPTLLRRLEREAESLARLEHPGIARLYQVGTSTAGGAPQPWFAMELIDGLPLLDFARQHRLPRRGRIDLLARIADAVQHAHLRGIVHRDLKPANVLVSEDPTASDPDAGAEVERGASPKILDFGVARWMGSVEATAATEPGRIVGTLSCMSPEQCDPDGEVDARSDVYSLGVMAFELLSGARPYELSGLPIAAALRTIQEAEAPGLGTIDPGLRGDIDTIVAKALEKEPGRRYQAAADFAADLRRYLRDEPIQARPPTRGERVRRYVRRHRVLVQSAAAIGLTLVVALVLVGREAARARRAEVLAEERARAATRAEQTAERERDEATATSEDLGITLSLLGDILLASDPYVQGKVGITVAEVLDQAAARLRSRTELRPRVMAQAALVLGRAFFGQRDRAQAVEWFARALQLLREQEGDAARGTIEAAVWLARTEAAWGSLDAARELLAEQVEPFLPDSDRAALLQHQAGLARISLLHRSLDLPAAIEQAQQLYEAGKRRGLDPATLQQAQLEWIRVLLDAGEGHKAKAQAGQLLTEREEQFGPGHPATHAALALLLEAETVVGEIEAAKELAERLRTTILDSDQQHPDHVDQLAKASRALRQAGDLEAAERCIDAALERSRKWRGEDHPGTLSLRNTRALLWMEGGRPELRAELIALRSACETIDERNSVYASVTANLALVLQQEGDLAAALPLHREAARWYAEVMGPEHDSTLNARANVATALLQAGELDEACRLLEEIHARRSQTLGADHPTTLLDGNSLAVARKRRGQLAEAEALFAALAAGTDRAFPEGHPRRGVARLTWALCLLEMQRFEAAEPLLVASLELFRAALPRGHRYRTRALEGLIELYERTGHAEEVPHLTQQLRDETRAAEE